MRAEISVDARLENLRRIRDFIEEQCAKTGTDSSACFDLKLAVDEACTNIIEHGYAGAAGSIGVAFESGGGELRVTICDRGRSFSPKSVPPPPLEKDWSERPIGGLGWHLIRSAVDVVDYGSSPEGGNRLTLIKRSSVR
jgi:serine/threonine-protein kinase RsbW